ncbi:uncharacterized [Tachysurus ichikawai]
MRLARSAATRCAQCEISTVWDRRAEVQTQPGIKLPAVTAFLSGMASCTLMGFSSKAEPMKNPNIPLSVCRVQCGRERGNVEFY